MLEIAGLTFEDDSQLPDGFMPTEAIVIIVGVDSDGRRDIHQAATPGLPTPYAIGLLTMTCDTLRGFDRLED